MTVRYIADERPDVVEALELEQEMLAAGKTQAEVDEFMAQCREFDFAVKTAELRAAGLGQGEIVRFWTEFMKPMGDDPDSIDIAANTDEV